MKKVFIFSLIFILITCNLKANYEDSSEVEPYLAGFLSWHLSGFGHFYAKDYKRGSLYVLGDILIKTLGIYLTKEFNKKYKQYHSEYFIWDDHEDIKGISDKDKTMVIIYLTGSYIFRIINVIDTVITVQKYNKKIKLIKKSDLQTVIGYEEKF